MRGLIERGAVELSPLPLSPLSSFYHKKRYTVILDWYSSHLQS